MPNFVQCLQQQLRPDIYVEAIKLYRQALKNAKVDAVSLVEAMSASGTEDESGIQAANVIDEGNIRNHLRLLLKAQLDDLAIQGLENYGKLLNTLNSDSVLPLDEDIRALSIPPNLIKFYTRLEITRDKDFDWASDRVPLLSSIMTSVWVNFDGLLRDLRGEPNKKHDVQLKKKYFDDRTEQLALQRRKLIAICEDYEKHLNKQIKSMRAKAKKCSPKSVATLCDKYVHMVKLHATLNTDKPVSKQLIDFQQALPAASAVIQKSRDTKGMLVLKAFAAALLIVVSAGLLTCAVGLLFNVRGAEESRRMDKRIQKYQHLFN